MIDIYAKLIMAGMKTLDDVPLIIRGDVAARLEAVTGNA